MSPYSPSPLSSCFPTTLLHACVTILNQPSDILPSPQWKMNSTTSSKSKFLALNSRDRVSLLRLETRRTSMKNWWRGSWIIFACWHESSLDTNLSPSLLIYFCNMYSDIPFWSIASFYIISVLFSFSPFFFLVLRTRLLALVSLRVKIYATIDRIGKMFLFLSILFSWTWHFRFDWGVVLFGAGRWYFFWNVDLIDWPFYGYFIYDLLLLPCPNFM